MEYSEKEEEQKALAIALQKAIQESEEGSEVLLNSASQIDEATTATTELEVILEEKRREFQGENESMKRELEQLENEEKEIEKRVEAERVQRQMEREELDRQLGM